MVLCPSVLEVPGLPVLLSSPEGGPDSKEKGGDGWWWVVGGGGDDDSDSGSDMHLKKPQQPTPIFIYTSWLLV